MFDALETARVEALGARAMDGVRGNLSRADRGAGPRRCDPARPHRRRSAAGDRGRPARPRTPDRRRAAAGRAPGSKLVAPWIEEKAGAELDALALTLDDQAGLRQGGPPAARRPRLAPPPRTADEQPEDGGDEEQGDEGGADEGDDEGDEGAPVGGDMEMRGEEVEDEGDGRHHAAGDGARRGRARPTATTCRQRRRRAGRRNWDLAPETDYKAFTTRFDEMVEAEELCDDEELARLRAYLDQQMGGLHNVVTRLANRLQRRLMAQQARSWEFDQEEGLLDAARLARVVVNPMHSLELQDRARHRISRHDRRRC